jgi:SPP1 gp7 family putative phage head morphogenesis protein
MPIFGNQKQITPTENRPNKRRGTKRSNLLETEAGVPRFDDLLTTRVLGTTDVASLPKNVVKDHVKSTEWNIRPSIDNPSTDHEMAADEITEFLGGNFNKNNDEFDHLLTRWVDDLLDIDTGVIQKVPTANPVFDDGSHALAELYPEDGTVWTKNYLKNGVVPGAPEPAYYQYGMRPQLSTFEGITFDALQSEFDNFKYLARSAMSQKPIPYSRDEIVWTERNPRPEVLSPGQYGMGLTQQAQRWVEILLNQNLSNARQFTDDEHAKGILNLVDGNTQQIQQTRDYIRDQLKGQTDHKLPVVGGQDIEYISMQESLKELQFLESQQWYSKLVWMLYGLNESEVGFDVGSKAIAEEHRRQVFLNTTKPILETLQSEINRFILPDMEAYQRVNGELEFAFVFEDPDLEKLKRQKQQEDLTAGLATPNDVLRERGEEEKPWGDMPQEAVTQLARQHPEWVAEEWGGVENVPEPTSDDGGLFDMGYESDESTNDVDGDVIDSETTEEATPEEYDSGNGNIDVSKPLGPPEDPNRFEDWDECVDALSEDMSEEEAREVCGSWEQNKTPQNIHMAKAYGVMKDESLRNEHWTGEFPPVKGIVDELEKTIARHLTNQFDDLAKDVEDRWPDVDGVDEQRTMMKGLAVDIQELTAGIELADTLRDAVVSSNQEAMQVSADFDAQELEEELKDRADFSDEIAEIGLDFDLEDTFAMQAMQNRAAKNMTSVEESVRKQVETVLVEAADKGEGVNEVTSQLRDRVDEISDNHARLVARTETLQASREGEQALQESLDIVAGKEWKATDDSRTRPWHAAMDGEIVPKDEAFTVPAGWTGEPYYQPKDYPRSTKIVGGDQPFNCRCQSDPVLKGDMPEDLRELRDIDGVNVDLKLSDPQYRVWKDYAAPDESFAAFLKRVDGHTSRSKAVDKFCNGSKSQYYAWLKEYDLK